MHIKKNLENFLMDQEYYIDLFKNFIHVYYYESLTSLSANLIEIKLKDFSLEIKGEDLVVKEFDRHEILIKGIIKEMRFLR